MKYTLHYLAVVTVMSFALNSWGRLFFPVERNHIKILPQVFEYELMSDHEFIIGNLTLNLKNFDVQMSKANRNQVLFKVRIPEHRFSNGQLVIKDNSGKILISKDLRKKGQDDVLSVSPRDLVRKLEILPFFSVCLMQEESPARFLVCSQDYTFKVRNRKASLERLPTSTTTSFVEVNGRKSDSAGQVYLNSPTQPIFLRAILSQGGTVEIFSRMKVLDFRDAVASEDGKQLSFQIFGTEPSTETGAKLIGENLWEFSVLRERPLVFLNGEAGIPLKQEFVVKKDLGTALPKIAATQSIPNQIYSSSYTIDLEKSPSLKLSVLDKDSEVEGDDPDEATWTLRDIPLNKKTRRLLKITDSTDNSGTESVLAVELTRRPAWKFRTELAGPLSAELGITRFFSPRFSTGFRYTAQLLNAQTQPSLATASLGLNYLWLQFEKSSVTSSLLIHQESVGDKDSKKSLLGYGFRTEIEWLEPWGLLAKFVDDTTLGLTLVSGSSSETKYSRLPELDYRIGKNFGEAQHIDLGIRVALVKASSTGLFDENKTLAQGFIGWGVRF